MRISIAQIRPFKGDIARNIETHIHFVKNAVQEKSDLVVFPELSITGYEPTLAKELAILPDDNRLDVLQRLSNEHNITVCAGAPTRDTGEIRLSMIILQPQRERIVYSKRFLFKHENNFFSPGPVPFALQIDNEHVMAPAICYELSQTQHHEDAVQNGANLYVASVLNSVQGVQNDLDKLQAFATKYGMTTFLSNYVGHSGGYECAGRSSAWDKNGNLIAQLDGNSEGLIVYDTVTEKPHLIHY